MKKDKTQETEIELENEDEVNEPVALVVSPETGEVTNEIYEGDRIIRKKTTDFLVETIEIGKNEKFTKIFDNTLLALSDENMTGKQWKILILFINYFKYDSGLIAFDNGNPVGAEDVIELTGMSRKTVFDAINKLCEKKIISKTKVGFDIKYYGNPFIFCKGRRINKTLHTMFSKSKWTNYHAGIIK